MLGGHSSHIGSVAHGGPPFGHQLQPGGQSAPPPPFISGPLAGRQLPWSCTHCWENNEAHMEFCRVCNLSKNRMVPGHQSSTTQLPRALAPFDTSPFNRPQQLPTRETLAAGRAQLSRSPSFGDSPSSNRSSLPRSPVYPPEWHCQGCGCRNNNSRRTCEWCTGDRQVVSAEYGNVHAKAGDKISHVPLPPQGPPLAAAAAGLSPQTSRSARSPSPSRMIRFRGMPDMPVGFCASLYKDGYCNMNCSFRHTVLPSDPTQFVQQLEMVCGRMQPPFGSTRSPSSRQCERCNNVVVTRFCGVCGLDGAPPVHTPGPVVSSPYPTAGTSQFGQQVAGGVASTGCPHDVSHDSSQPPNVAATQAPQAPPVQLPPTPQSPQEIDPRRVKMVNNKPYISCNCGLLSPVTVRHCHSCGEVLPGQKPIDKEVGIKVAQPCDTCLGRSRLESYVPQHNFEEFLQVLADQDVIFPTVEKAVAEPQLDGVNTMLQHVLRKVNDVELWRGCADRLHKHAMQLIEILTDKQDKMRIANAKAAAAVSSMASSTTEVEVERTRRAIMLLDELDTEDTEQFRAINIVQRMLRASVPSTQQCPDPAVQKGGDVTITISSETDAVSDVSSLTEQQKKEIPVTAASASVDISHAELLQKQWAAIPAAARTRPSPYVIDGPKVAKQHVMPTVVEQPSDVLELQAPAPDSAEVKDTSLSPYFRGSQLSKRRLTSRQPPWELRQPEPVVVDKKVLETGVRMIKVRALKNRARKLLQENKLQQLQTLLIDQGMLVPPTVS